MRQLPYDPIGPLRDPRSRKCLRAAVRDMARVAKLVLQERGEVLDEDLIRAGFTLGELDHRAQAMEIVAGRAPTPRDETVLDMAAFLALRVVESADATVTRDDLHRGGFTASEIDECFADAQAETRKQLAPRQIRCSDRVAA